jgi:hypothetical protein
MTEQNDTKSRQPTFSTANKYNKTIRKKYTLGKSNNNKGYIKDGGFIDNKIIYDTVKRPRLEINKIYDVDENQEIKDKFKPSEELDKTNLEKYTGYESDDGFIVDDSEEISNDESSESEEYESSESDDSQSIILRKRLKKCSS